MKRQPPIEAVDGIGFEQEPGLPLPVPNLDDYAPAEKLSATEKRSSLATLGLAVVGAAGVIAYGGIARANEISPVPKTAAKNEQQPLATADSARRRANVTQALGAGAWSWFGDPRVVRITDKKEGINKVFAGWVDKKGGIAVGSIDRKTGKREKSLVGRVYKDDHASPAFLVEKDKRLTTFYTGHNGKEMYYRTSKRPGDITEWRKFGVIKSNLPGKLGFTYPNPVKLPKANKTFLFWRGGNWKPAFATRNEETGEWSKARQLISAKPRQRPYLKVAANDGNEIGMAFTEAHPRNEETGLYFMKYKNGSLRTAGGKKLGKPGRKVVKPSEKLEVYDQFNINGRAWVQDVAYDKKGHPVIAFTTLLTPVTSQYWTARWNGKGWVKNRLVDAGPMIMKGSRYSGGMALDPNKPSVAYLSRKIGKNWQIERWKTPNGGRSWSHKRVTRNKTNNVRPVVAQGQPGQKPDLLWLKGRYNTFKRYQTKVVVKLGK